MLLRLHGEKPCARLGMQFRCDLRRSLLRPWPRPFVTTMRSMPSMLRCERYWKERAHMQPVEYNPLAYDALQDSMAREFMASELYSLDAITKFEGTGIYALFYSGPFPAYQALAERPKGTWPIYVGKAAPSARKGAEAEASGLIGPYGNTRLYERVMHHRKSIAQVCNLEVTDFQVRLLVLSYIWVPLAETAMISQYQPIWNTLVDGFGNHDPGKGRAEGLLSRWDTLHPGRPWANKYPPRLESQEDIAQDVLGALRTVMC